MNNLYIRQFFWALAGLLFISLAILATIGLSRLLLRRNDAYKLDFSGQYMLGIALVLVIVLAWNLLGSVNPVLFWSLHVFGASVLVASLQRKKIILVTWFLPCLVGLVVASRCLLDGLSLQSQIDGYHYTMVNWLHATTTPPGLANLDGRLGFNSSNLVLAALFSSSPLAELSLPFLNYSLLISLAVASISSYQERFIDGDGWSKKISTLYAVSLIIPVVYFSFTIRGLFPPSSLSSDLPALLTQLYAIYVLIRLFEAGSRDARSFWFAVWALVAMLSISFKVSSAAFYVATFAGLCWPSWSRDAVFQSIPKFPRLWIGTFLLLGLWLLRGAMLSGYILFPSLSFPLPVDWRMPYELATQLNNIISRWGDMRLQQFLQDLSAPSRYFMGQVHAFVIPFSLSVVGSYSLFRKCRSSLLFRQLFCCLVISTLASLLVWILSAPDPRFVLSIAWIWGLLGWVALVQDVQVQGLLNYSLILVLIFAPIQRLLVEHLQFNRTIGLGLREVFWRTPPGPSGIYQFPNPVLTEVKTCGGAKVFLADYPWRAPLNTSDAHTSSSCLQPRVPGNHLAGFRYSKDCRCTASNAT